MREPLKNKERGSAILEFALIVNVLVLLFFGVTGLGIMMGRYDQAVQVARDVAHMYSGGVDFTQTTNQNIVIDELAAGTGMTATGGNGVVILSQIATVYQADCTAAAVSPCTNVGKPVFTQRIVFGNSTLRASSYGTPSSTILDAEGNILPSVYMSNSDPTVLTTGFETAYDSAVGRATGTTPSPPGQPQGETAYIVEIVFQYPDIGFLGWSTAGGAYASFIYQ